MYETRSVPVDPAKSLTMQIAEANNLPPTYSMVSYCPFVGTCCFLPMNILSLGIGGAACNTENCSLLSRTKALWDDRLRVNVDCDINTNTVKPRELKNSPKKAYNQPTEVLLYILKEYPRSMTFILARIT